MLPTCRSIGHILSQFNLHPCSGGGYLLIHWTCLLLILGYQWSVLADAVVHKNHTQDSNDKCSSACDYCSNPHCSTCAEGSLCKFWMENIIIIIATSLWLVPAWWHKVLPQDWGTCKFKNKAVLKHTVQVWLYKSTCVELCVYMCLTCSVFFRPFRGGNLPP